MLIVNLAGQLNPNIPRSTLDRRNELATSRHTERCTSPVLVVSRCKADG